MKLRKLSLDSKKGIKMKRKLVMLILLLLGNGNRRAKYLRKKEIFHKIGNEVYWHPISIPSEPFLVSIGNNVRVATKVTFITHDIMGTMFNRSDCLSKYGYQSQFIGKIIVGNNVFIGANAIIMYNVEIGDNSVIAAGSVVVNNVPNGSIVGGNPAKIIGSVIDLAQKRSELNLPSRTSSKEILNNYFWS